MGIFPSLSIAIFDSSLSTQMTSFPFSARQAPTTSPTYPVPTIAIFILYLSLGAAPQTSVRGGARVLRNGTSHGEMPAEYHNNMLTKNDLGPARSILRWYVPGRMVTL